MLDYLSDTSKRDKLFPKAIRNEKLVNHTKRPAILFANGTLITMVVVVAVFYVAREILIPVALAVLLSFLLAPLVIRFRHWGFGKYPAVASVMLIFLLFISLVSGLVTAQLVDLASKLPRYQQNVHEKLKSFSVPKNDMFERFSKFFDELGKDINTQTPGAKAENQTAPSTETKPVPVEIRQRGYSWRVMGAVLGSLIGPLLKTGIIIVLIIFMVLQREDMRDRLIRLVGAGHLNSTTKALDDATQRVSRYLLMQLLVNATYAIPIGLGLYFMGIPNPILWAVLAALLRFVPYLGIWIAALMPAAVAFAIEPGWTASVSVLVLFFSFDIVTANFLEPLIYGASTGISPLAILLAAIFWTWLWGPIGLLLSTPLTVCLTVIGRYVPDFEFLGIMLTDKQVLSSETRFYQRLLAMDLEEATGIGEAFLKDHTLEELYDELIIPALVLAEEDRQRGTLDENREQFIFQNTAFLIEEFGERFNEIKAAQTAKENVKETEPAVTESAAKVLPATASVVVIPARDEADALAGQMLAVLLKERGIRADTLPAGDIVNGYIEHVTQQKVSVVCVSSLPTPALMHARHVCKRLQAQQPDLKIILGLWGENDSQKQKRSSAAINCIVVTTLKEAVERIVPLVATHQEPARELAPESTSRRLMDVPR